MVTFEETGRLNMPSDLQWQRGEMTDHSDLDWSWPKKFMTHCTGITRFSPDYLCDTEQCNLGSTAKIYHVL